MCEGEERSDDQDAAWLAQSHLALICLHGLRLLSPTTLELHHTLGGQGSFEFVHPINLVDHGVEDQLRGQGTPLLHLWSAKLPGVLPRNIANLVLGGRKYV